MTPRQPGQAYASAEPNRKTAKQPRWKLTIELPHDQPRIPAILLASMARCIGRAGDVDLASNTNRELLQVLGAITAELQLRRR